MTDAPPTTKRNSQQKPIYIVIFEQLVSVVARKRLLFPEFFFRSFFPFSPHVCTIRLFSFVGMYLLGILPYSSVYMVYHLSSHRSTETSPLQERRSSTTYTYGSAQHSRRTAIDRGRSVQSFVGRAVARTLVWSIELVMP